MRVAICVYGAVVLLCVFVSLFILEDTAVVLAAIAAGVLATITAVIAAIVVRKNPRGVAVIAGGFVVCIGILTSVAQSDWPLRLAFLVSRPALENVASEVRTGHTFKNRWVGLFFVHHAELGRSGIPCLWVDPSPAGPTGFVQTSPDVLPFNIWSVISLDHRWQMISED